jgi:hypothetical protein
MKALDYLFSTVLGVMAALQYNDPDPTYWILVYGCSAVVAMQHARRRPGRFLAAATLGMILSGMIYAAPGFLEYLQAGNLGVITASMDGSARYVEPAREFLGLLIALLVVSSYSLRWSSN